MGLGNVKLRDPEPVKEAQFVKFEAPHPEDLAIRDAQPDPSEVAIVIDNGSHQVRAGWSFADAPRVTLPPISSKFRDRKLGKTYALAGNDCYLDATSRSHIRAAFEPGTGIIANWDSMENVLDYIFLKMALNSGEEDRINHPIVMTEPVANLAYARKSMTEIIFECYRAPSLCFGIDSLFAYRRNGGSTGVIVSASHSATHVVPVYNSLPVLSQAVRLNWGGWHASDWLLRLLRLKYPTFPGKLHHSQAEHMFRDYCYVARDYDKELRTYLDWTGLEDRERIVQWPYTEEVVVQKTEEELARAAERKREGGRRLQEQAAKMRLEKLMKKEEELEYYRSVQARIAEQTNKKNLRRILDDAEVRDEAALERRVRELDKAIRKARTKDVGGADEPAEAPVWDLLDVPDDQLDEAGIKAKRQQRLQKSGYDARQRAKAEKEAEAARVAAEKAADVQRRETDLEGWLEGRRQQLAAARERLRERERQRADQGNRKSLASQMRMKSLASLASDNPSRKRRRGNPDRDDDDNFGANDDDWGVYRAIGGEAGGSGAGGGGDNSDSEDGEEDILESVRAVERELLEFDDKFDEEDTWDAEHAWDKSLVHAFLRGPAPFDEGSAREAHQIHLNVERIRVPEVLFSPAIAGVDQAGVVEILGDLLTQRLVGVGGAGVDGPGSDAFLRDIFVTGGLGQLKNFDERLADGLRALLPAGAPLNVRKGKNWRYDAWLGARDWVRQETEYRSARVTREEYLEKGSDYIKEHSLGNAPTY